MNNLEIAYTWFDAFNEHDIEKLIALYHPDAEHFSPRLKSMKPETNGFIRGHDALYEWWDDAFRRLPHLRYKVLHMISDGEEVFMEYTRSTREEKEIQVKEVLVIRDEKIVASRVLPS
jgi:ketosteroid isomerase-like protein